MTVEIALAPDGTWTGNFPNEPNIVLHSQSWEAFQIALHSFLVTHLPEPQHA